MMIIPEMTRRKSKISLRRVSEVNGKAILVKRERISSKGFYEICHIYHEHGGSFSQDFL
jgi:hypothetical protein